MLKAVFAAVLLVAAVSTGVQAAGPKMILASHYNVEGTNPGGSRYSGTVDVNVISTTTFTIVWHVGGGTTDGFGMRMGDTISGTYLLGDKPGLVIYRQTDDGGFKGIWSIKGHNGSGTEEWSPAD